MIVRDRPNAIALLFTLRGSVVPEILPHIVCVALFSVVWTALSRWHVVELGRLTIMPVTLLGIVLSILLGFRNNASYDRWWEARKQWGQMVYEIRSLARASRALLAEAPRRRLLHQMLAHAHALKGQLREEDGMAEAARWLSEQDSEALAGKRNRADAILALAGEGLKEFLDPVKKS